MRHSKPASSVQEVPKVTAPGPDRPSSVQAFHDGAAAFYATTVASPTLHPYMGRRQVLLYLMLSFVFLIPLLPFYRSHYTQKAFA
ncbi:light-inducible protein CPRF3 [Daucus carota subsp. sativus]|uniref:light-inducible protein CPRF3 n=1 Tax=Daucus carota subsp. sativus TaxID=79200 RepID=UPI0030834CA2